LAFLILKETKLILFFVDNSQGQNYEENSSSVTTNTNTGPAVRPLSTQESAQNITCTLTTVNSKDGPNSSQSQATTTTLVSSAFPVPESPLYSHICDSKLNFGYPIDWNKEFQVHFFSFLILTLRFICLTCSLTF
jgi:hypothetical protein